jgi:hypothetical protein
MFRFQRKRLEQVIAALHMNQLVTLEQVMQDGREVTWDGGLCAVAVFTNVMYSTVMLLEFGSVIH